MVPETRTKRGVPGRPLGDDLCSKSLRIKIHLVALIIRRVRRKENQAASGTTECGLLFLTTRLLTSMKLVCFTAPA